MIVWAASHSPLAAFIHTKGDKMKLHSLLLLLILSLILPACGSEDNDSENTNGDNDSGTETETYSTICPEGSDEAFNYEYSYGSDDGTSRRYKLHVAPDRSYTLSNVNVTLLNESYEAATNENQRNMFSFSGTVLSEQWNLLLTDVEDSISELSGSCLILKTANDCEWGATYSYSFDEKYYAIFDCPQPNEPSWGSDMAIAMQSIDAILRPWVIATAKAQLTTLELGATCPAEMAICVDGSYCKDGVCTAASAE